MNELFEKYDGLIMPTSGNIAPLFDDASDKLSDEYLILGNHLVIGNFGDFLVYLFLVALLMICQLVLILLVGLKRIA